MTQLTEFDHMRTGYSDYHDLGCIVELMRAWAIDNKGLYFGHHSPEVPWRVFAYANIREYTYVTGDNGAPLEFDTVHELVKWLLNDAPDWR